MYWWVKLILTIGYYLLARSQAPDPVSQGPGELKAATAEEGGNIPVLFGTRTISNQNVVWYGDIKIIPLKKKGGKK